MRIAVQSESLIQVNVHKSDGAVKWLRVAFDLDEWHSGQSQVANK